MSSLVGAWGLFQWFEEHGWEHVHPEDRAKVVAQHPVGLIFECREIDGEYIVLYCHDNRLVFRAKPSLFVVVPDPPVRVGDAVSVISEGRVKQARVRGMGWHYKRNQHMFFLVIDGKRATKRYWFSDFLHPVD